MKTIKDLDPNLGEAIERILYHSKESDIDNIDISGEFYLKYTWTQRDQDKYTEWLAGFLTKNWSGILKYKPINKKACIKAAQFFVLDYGLKTRDLTIEDFGMEVVPDGQLKDTMSEYEYSKFMEWMAGQTMSMHGVYRYDLERYLNGASAMHLY